MYFVLAQRTQPFPMFVQSESVLHDGPRCPTTHLPWVAGTAVQCFGRLVVQRRQPLMPSQSESPLHCGPFMWPKQSCPWLAATPLAITIVIAAAEKSTVRVIAGGATMIAHPLRRPLLQMIRAAASHEVAAASQATPAETRAEWLRPFWLTDTGGTTCRMRRFGVMTSGGWKNMVAGSAKRERERERERERTGSHYSSSHIVRISSGFVRISSGFVRISSGFVRISSWFVQVSSTLAQGSFRFRQHVVPVVLARAQHPVDTFRCPCYGEACRCDGGHTIQSSR